MPNYAESNFESCGFIKEFNCGGWKQGCQAGGFKWLLLTLGAEHRWTPKKSFSLLKMMVKLNVIILILSQNRMNIMLQKQGVVLVT